MSHQKPKVMIHALKDTGKKFKYRFYLLISFNNDLQNSFLRHKGTSTLIKTHMTTANSEH